MICKTDLTDELREAITQLGKEHSIYNGIHETIAPENLSTPQKDWIAGIQKFPDGAPHPRDYIHGALFLFREPQECAALIYELRAALVWNSALVSADVAKRIYGALHAVIPEAKLGRRIGCNR